MLKITIAQALLLDEELAAKISSKRAVRPERENFGMANQ